MSSTTPKVITRSDPTRIEVEWSDGHRTQYRASELRGLCPCAMCVNEVSGVRVHDPATVPADLTQNEARMVGNYALTMTFSDGHHTGIFTFPFLRAHDPLAPLPGLGVRGSGERGAGTRGTRELPGHDRRDVPRGQDA